MKTLFVLPLSLLATFAVTLNLGGAVKNGAFLQGSNLADGSTVLDSATPKAISWTEKASVDLNVFDYSASNSSQLTVKQAGDYLVAVTVPVISINTADNRPCQAVEVYVNGEIAPGTVGSSGYIRNQPRNNNMQQETSLHANALLTGLEAGDVIEARVRKTAQAALATGIQTASLFVELIDDSRTVFSALSDGPADGTNLNPNFEEGDEDFAYLSWTSTRKDSGYGHSGTSTEIELAPGVYQLFVNVPMQSTVQRAAPGLEISLDDSPDPIRGGTARQGYIRNASGHTVASLHWAGIVEVSGTQALSVRMLRLAEGGQVIIQEGKQASLYLEKLDEDNGVLSTYATVVDNDGAPDNWNPANKTKLVWEEEMIGDSGTYRLNDSEIQIRAEGNYLLLYQDTLQSTAVRPNPRITVEVNGVEAPGAQTKTHYIRNSNGHNESSGTLVYLLENLAANDVLTVSTQREGQAGDVFIDEFSVQGAILTLIAKESVDLSTIQAPPLISSVSGDVNGFSVMIQNFAVTVDEGSVKTSVNDAPVTAEVNTTGGVTMVSWNFEDIPDSLSVHLVKIEFQDSEGQAHAAEFEFTVSKVFTRIPPDFATGGVDTGTSGFIARVTQISTEQSGAQHVHGNNLAGAERQLAGEFTNADGDPYLNEAGPENATEWVVTPVDIETVINLDQAAGALGNFRTDGGFPDAMIPGIPGFHDQNDGIVAEFLTYLELEAGFHTLAVNSDDGFEVSTGPALLDVGATMLGRFNGSRGVAETQFNLYVEETGVYPFRLLWFEGGGGANVEFYSITKDGQRILINDRDNPMAIKAYRDADARPYISSIIPQGTVLTDTLEYVINDGSVKVVDGSVTLTLDGTAVTPQINKSGGVTTVTYSMADGYFPGGDHVAMLGYEEASTPVRSRAFRHEFTVPQGQTAVLLDNPFAYWRLGEQEGTAAVNAVGSVHTGIYNNSPGLGAERLVVGESSTSVMFDSAAQHWIRIVNHADINNLGGNPGWSEKTIEFWFKSRTLPSDDDAVEGVELTERQVLYEQGGATRGMNIYLAGTKPGPNPSEAELWFNVLNRAETAWGGTLPHNEDQGFSPNGEVVGVSTVVKPDTLYHVVFVYHGDTQADSFEGGVTGYLNGEPFGTTLGANILRNHTDGIGIGRRNSEVSFHDFIVNNAQSPEVFNSPQQFYFDGWIDEFALYNHALTEAQVKAHYEAGMTEVPADPGTGGPTSIMLALSADGMVMIEFSGGSLHSSETVDGGFEPVAGATSPYSTPPAGTARFYLVK